MCSDPELIGLHQRYDRSLRLALATRTDFEQVREDDRRWRSEVRNGCSNVDCLFDVYFAHVDDLGAQQDVLLEQPPKHPYAVLAAWIVLIATAFCLAIGTTNSAVVFYDLADAGWAIMPGLTLGVAAFVARGIVPQSLPLTGSPAALGVLAFGAVAAGIGIIVTYRNAVRYNRNVALGLVIGTGKLIVSAVMAVTFVGALHGAIDTRGNRSRSTWLALLTILLGFLWVALINGMRVYEKRGWEAVAA